MDEDLINRVKALKSTMEETIQSSKRLDILVSVFLTEEEIEEVFKLREKQRENMQRLVDISNYIITGKSDKLEAKPDIDMIFLEMSASSTLIGTIEDQILNIYEKVKLRLFDI